MTFTKSLIITILYVTVLFTAKAQTAVEDNVISFSLPKGSQKLSADAFNDQFKKLFKRPQEAFTDGTSIITIIYLSPFMRKELL
jgi:hypothetical protein